MFFIEYDQSRKLYTKDGKILMPLTERSKRRLDIVLYAGIVLFFVSLIVIFTVLYQENIHGLKTNNVKSTVTKNIKP